MKAFHVFYHLTLAWACRIGLAAVFVPSAVLLPVVGDWFASRMWHHDLMASTVWEGRPTEQPEPSELAVDRPPVLTRATRAAQVPA